METQNITLAVPKKVLTKFKEIAFRRQKSISKLMTEMMEAACLAYLWIVYLGCVAVREDWVKIIHRPDRCDWSLFRLGLALLDHFLNELIPIPVSFNLLEKNCVR